MLLSLLTCREALARLDDYLDRELTPDEVIQVQRHLKLCRQCSRRFAFERTFVDDLRAKLARIDAPIGLLESISASLHAQESQMQDGG